MVPLHPIHTPPTPRTALLSPGVITRTALALAALVALSVMTLPLMAREAAMRLRGDVTARGDALTLGDLVEGAPAEFAGRALFRAPALGATGTIQARRIAEAVAGLGLPDVETGGRLQVIVQRAARRVGPPEIEAALKRALTASYGLDARMIGLRLDGEAPNLLAPVDLDGPATALDVTYDARSRRLTGLVVLGERQASLRVAGQVIEIREVAVLTRSLARGDALQDGDVTLERRPRETAPADAQVAPATLAGLVAQRSLTAGAVLRFGDAAAPDLVARGEAVTLVFETPGVSLSMRGIANDGGRLGATVSVLNTASKKIVQGTVSGPGRVSVAPPGLPRPTLQASAAP